MALNWLGVNEFVAVAEHSSFTQAAEKLGISVVNVSRRVSSLENHLGVKLVHRTTRKVSLTDLGKLYYQQTKPLIEGLEQAELTLHNLQESISGLLRITAPIAYGETHLGPLLLEFMQQHPNVQIDLELTNQQLNLVDSNIDVAIRLGHLEDSSLVAKRLTTRNLHVCASPEYFDQHGTPSSVSDLKRHRCLGGTLNQWRFKVDGKDKNLGIVGLLKCNSGPLLVKAAKQGLGLVQLPDYYVSEAIESGSLVEVLKQYVPAKEGVWAVYTPNRNLSIKVRTLIDFLSEKLD